MSAFEAIKAAQEEARLRSERLEETNPDYRVVFLSIPTVLQFRALIEAVAAFREDGTEIPEVGAELNLLYDDLGDAELYGPVADPFRE